MTLVRHYPLPPLAALTETGRLRAPRELFARLQFVAALLRDAPPEDRTAGGRLLWRNAQGEVSGRAVDGPIVIGRASDCEVVLDSVRVSRRHCEVVPEGETGTLRDLGSTNGTRVNGVEVGGELCPLGDGDVLEAGGVWIAYAISDAVRRDLG